MRRIAQQRDASVAPRAARLKIENIVPQNDTGFGRLHDSFDRLMPAAERLLDVAFAGVRVVSDGLRGIPCRPPRDTATAKRA